MAISMRESYGQALAAYGESNPNVVVLDADTASSTFSNYFAKRFPERFFNLGIAEPCMVDVAVGFALGGKVPFANAFAALLALRALEQIRTCVAYARTNVKLIAGYAGVSDFKDGPTHHSITDLANLRALPEMTVIVPADAAEVAAWVPVVAEHDGPVYLRLSRAATLDVHANDVRPQIGKGWTLRAGNDVTLIACGALVGRALQAAEALAQKHIHARVLEISTLKPLDAELILAAAEQTHGLVTAEEHSVIGGLGSAVAETLGERHPTPLQRVGIRDTFTRTGKSPEILMDALGLGVADLVRAAEHVLERKK